MAATEQIASKPRRRWYQYSVRSLLVFMLVASNGCGWMANKARREREAVAWVEKMGGDFMYDPDAQSWWWRLFRFPEPVQQVDFHGTQVSELSPLAGLKSLYSLNLANTKVNDEQVQRLQKALPSCQIIR